MSSLDHYTNSFDHLEKWLKDHPDATHLDKNGSALESNYPWEKYYSESTGETLLCKCTEIRRTAFLRNWLEQDWCRNHLSHLIRRSLQCGLDVQKILDEAIIEDVIK